MSGRKAISAVVAIVLLLMMTVAASGFAYVFMTGLSDSSKETADASLGKITEEISKCMAIDSVYANKVYVRNCGSGILKKDKIQIFVNGKPASFNGTFTEIAEGDTKEISVAYPSVSESNKIEIKGAEGGAVSKVVTEQSLAKDFNSDNALVGYWKFDEGSGDKAYDGSGNNNVGTLVNGPSWTNGKFGSALQFDGTNDYVEVPDSASLDITKAITIEAWVYINQHTNLGGIVTKGNSSFGSYAMQLASDNTNKIRFTYNQKDPWGYYIDSNSALPSNVWTHAVVSWDGSSVRFYINGVLDKTSPLATTLEICPTCNLGIGHDKPGADEYFNGTIDDVRIYNRALSSEEIATLYAMGQ